MTTILSSDCVEQRCTLLDRLKQQGLITRQFGRDPDDLRRANVGLTAKGRRQVNASLHAVDQHLRATPTARRRLQAALERVDRP